jgi:hypothetical protein
MSEATDTTALDEIPVKSKWNNGLYAVFKDGPNCKVPEVPFLELGDAEII